jgi:Flp pilus assembly protein TadD
MKLIKNACLLSVVLVISACSTAPHSSNQIECNGERYPVTYMSEMQQYEVERFAMRHEFRPGCVSGKLKEIKAKTCQTASSLSYEQWMSLYNGCVVNTP